MYTLNSHIDVTTVLKTINQTNPTYVEFKNDKILDYAQRIRVWAMRVYDVINTERKIRATHIKCIEPSFEVVCRTIFETYHSKKASSFWNEQIKTNDPRLKNFMEKAKGMKPFVMVENATDAELMVIQDLIRYFDGREEVKRISITETELITAVFIVTYPDVRTKIALLDSKKIKLL